MIILKCICCDVEIEHAASFIIAKDGNMWAVCSECLSTLTAADARDAQMRADLPEDPEPEYDPGLIEEGL